MAQDQELTFRRATPADIGRLAEMNRRLIVDEGHRNTMTVPQLEQRMREWLDSTYHAVLFERSGNTIGYALYRREPDHVYLRQFYVDASSRRLGIGRSAIEHLRRTEWSQARRVRLDVLIGNERGIAFWRAAGFHDYCLTMELEPVPPCT